MLTKEQKGVLFEEHKGYIDTLVAMFIIKHKTFYYLKSDLCSECYLKFLEVIDDYDGELSKFTTYIYGHMLSAIKNYVNKEFMVDMRHDKYAKSIEEEPDEYMGTPFVFDEMIECEDITDHQKEVLTMYFKQDMTQADIAKAFGVSQKSISVLIQKGLKHLRKKFYC